MTLSNIQEYLEEEIEDAEEETFLLYAQPIPSSNLGFIDPKSPSVDVTVAGRSLTIHQSPGVLASDRAGGTTGAVLWKITPLFANWLASPSNFLFSSSILSSTSAILELGCGISPLNALSLSPRVGSYILTDQTYVAKLINTNIAENSSTVNTIARKQHSSKSSQRNNNNNSSSSNITFTPLDWETDLPSAALIPGSSNDKSFDAVLACDCVYNYALIPPLVSTCAEACKLRDETESKEGGEAAAAAGQTLCIVAQQLRNDDVFCSWLAAFMEKFRVWRVKGEALPEELRPSAGFVVHVGVLRE
ncbi:Ribosomal protein lysine methyltransferase [Lecanicillium sp. MT-2017a]|nr:Ribosomal protein lysine methyltransferase [Lecanicillium sp. MT-2017a]